MATSFLCHQTVLATVDERREGHDKEDAGQQMGLKVILISEFCSDSGGIVIGAAVSDKYFSVAQDFPGLGITHRH